MQTKLIFSDPKKDFLNLTLVFEGEKLPSNLPKTFKGKKLQTHFLSEKSTLVVGLGKKEECNLDYYRRAGSIVTKTAASYEIEGVNFFTEKLNEKICVALLEGALLGNYSFDKYKSEDNKNFELKHICFSSDSKKFSKKLNEIIIICENVCEVRNLVSDNSSIVNPDFLEKTARKISKKHRLKIKVIKGKELEKKGLNLISAVGQASKVSPRLIILEYTGTNSKEASVLFVGKGITFDSGGLDIKIHGGMKEMRMDMAGAATVLGIIKASAELKLKKNITVILTCAENLVGSNAQRPGDIVKAYSGQTVEVLNTDAEGRLVLADALAYGNKEYSPKVIVEYSTLTGAVLIALGENCAGLISTSKKYEDLMVEAGLNTYERVWPLPLFEEYLDEVKSDKADLKSINKGRNNGTIFAGAFLSKFVEKTPFVHIDIAGTAMLEEAKFYSPKEGSGFGVRLGLEFLDKI